MTFCILPVLSVQTGVFWPEIPDSDSDEDEDGDGDDGDSDRALQRQPLQGSGALRDLRVGVGGSFKR
jgi:hypothetical protein